jgi:hypothetical protein
MTAEIASRNDLQNMARNCLYFNEFHEKANYEIKQTRTAKTMSQIAFESLTFSDFHARLEAQ